MKTERRRDKAITRWAGFFLRAALFFLTVAVLITVRLPGQLRAYAYEVYREAARTNMEFRTRNLPYIEGDHVRVKYQPQDREYAGIVLDAAERFYSPVAQKYGLKSTRKVTVVVYPSREDLNASFGWAANESAMGVYWVGVIRVLSPSSWVEEKDPREMREVFANVGPMAHELTHLAVDYATRGNCPRWFTEGLAQLEEYQLTGFRFTDLSGSDSRRFYPLRDLDRGFDDLADQALAYRESLSAVEYVNSVYGKDKLMEIVSLLGSGRGIGDAVEGALGVSLDKFQQNWRIWSGF